MDGVTNYLLTQGVLGISVFILGGVIVYLQRKLDKKDAEMKQLNDLRITDTKDHIKDYREVAKESASTYGQVAQTLTVIGEKIEAGKRR